MYNILNRGKIEREKKAFFLNLKKYHRLYHESEHFPESEPIDDTD